MIRLNLNFTNRTRFTLLGTTGGGKSNFLKTLIMNFRKYIILDYIHDYNSEWGHIARTPNQIFDLLKKGANKIIFQYPRKPPKSVVETFFDIVFDYMPNFFVVCEETDRYAGSRSSEDSAFMNFMNLGRHHFNGWACVSRRLGRLNLDVISYSEYIISFFQHTDNDLNRLKKYMGDVAFQLKTLPKHHFLVWDVLNQNLNRGEKWEIFSPVKLMP